VTIRLVVADDHTVLREALAGLLDRQNDMTVLGQASDGREAVDLVRAKTPDVALLDVAMPGFDGLWALEELRLDVGTRCLMLSMNAEPELIRQSAQSGACGYVTKDAATDELLGAIRAVARGRHYFNVKPAAPPSSPPISGLSCLGSLSAREREVFVLVALGHTSKEIGKQLNISPSTVDVYRSRLMKKVGVTTRAELVQLALAHGMLTG